MNLTRLIPFFVVVATNCHSAIAKDGQARRLEENWEYFPTATNRSKGKALTVTTSALTCIDDTAFKFTVFRAGFKLERTCAFIIKNASKLQRRQALLCGREENGVRVSSKCCAACTKLPPNPSPCDDDDTFTFALENGNTDVECAWLNKNNSDDRKLKYCKKGPVKGNCLASCDNCSCAADSDTFKFNLGMTIGTSTSLLVGCDWFGKRNTEDRRAKYCVKSGPFYNKIIADTCVSGCFCGNAKKSPKACDVTTFNQLRNAINAGNKDIKICSGTIVFRGKINLIDKQLKFTCPNGGCVLDAESKNRFFYIRGVTSNISFDGITFKDGHAYNIHSKYGYGGAILNKYGTVFITACRFIGNRVHRFGGAIQTAGKGSSVIITGTHFEGNGSNYRGYNICFGRSGIGGSGSVTCNDDKNTFISYGGGGNGGSDFQGNYPHGLCDRACDVTTFDELKSATYGNGDIKICSGTIVFTEQIDLSMKELTFTCPNGGCVLDGESKSRLFNYVALPNPTKGTGETSNISFDGITFKNGYMPNGGVGAAIYNDRGTFAISRCRFIGNKALYGGAIYNRDYLDEGAMVITYSEFEDNIATSASDDLNPTDDGNNIYNLSADFTAVTCNDDTNTFNPAGNFPVGLCAPNTP